jgi:hypothetical protein
LNTLSCGVSENSNNIIIYHPTLSPSFRKNDTISINAAPTSALSSNFYEKINGMKQK